MISFDFTSLEKKVTERTGLLRELKSLKVSQIENENKFADLEEALSILQFTAQQLQQKVHHRISTVVSKCLETVFDDPYEFNIVFELKAGRTEARIQFVRDSIGVDPLTASGGGVVDVAAFALRIACLSLRRPALRRLLVFDEPFRFVSAEFRPRVRELLENLAQEFGLQLIMITHIQELRCGNVISFK